MIDGNSELVAYVYRKTFFYTFKFITASMYMNALNRLPISPHTCALYSELPSDINIMERAICCF